MARIIRALIFSAFGLAAALGADLRLVAPGELEGALGKAVPGSTLVLSAGVHPGPVIVTRSIRLVGRPGAIIQGNGVGAVVTLAAPNSSVSGLTIRGGGSDLSTDDTTVLVRQTQGVTVEHCRIEARAFGIYLEAGSGHHIRDNLIQGDGAVARSRRGNGIHLWHTEKNDIAGNRLIDVRDGIYLSFAHDNLIRANAGSGLRYGIHYMYSERNRLLENRFDHCTGGITLMFSRENKIEANQLSDNRDFGMLCLQLDRSVLSNNEITRDGRGLFIEESTRNRFRDNKMIQNGVGAFVTAGSEMNSFSGNRFEGNLIQVFQTHPELNEWSEQGKGNYWSDYAGFDWNGDGIGDTPYRMETTASALMARRPVARWFWMSPVLALVDWLDSWTRTSDLSFFDRFPLVDKRGLANRFPEVID